MNNIEALERNFPMTQVNNVLANHEETDESVGV
jgi:hypothetical protein